MPKFSGDHRCAGRGCKYPSCINNPINSKPDYKTKCSVCQATPTLPITGMCGPCTFGDASTAGGNW